MKTSGNYRDNMGNMHEAAVTHLMIPRTKGIYFDVKQESRFINMKSKRHEEERFGTNKKIQNTKR